MPNVLPLVQMENMAIKSKISVLNATKLVPNVQDHQILNASLAQKEDFCLMDLV